MAFLPRDFFRFNETDYEFPHADCDMKTSEELQAYFFSRSYLCYRILTVYCKEYNQDVTKCMLAAQEHRGLRICGETFMRLKFMLEVMNLRLLRSKLAIVPKHPKSGFMKPPISEIWSWESSAGEHYSQVDVMANRVFLYIIQTLKKIVTNVEEDSENAAWITQRLDAFKEMNLSIQKIRTVPCGSILWERFQPNELSTYPYCIFLLELWKAVKSSLLQCEHTESPLPCCPSR